MKITKANHKAVLTTLFYEKAGDNPNGTPIYKTKIFPFDKLMDASSAAKKLAEGSEQKEDRIYYKDGEIELTPAETTILKTLFDAKKVSETDGFDIGTADSAFELDKLFKGEQEK